MRYQCTWSETLTKTYTRHFLNKKVHKWCFDSLFMDKHARNQRGGMGSGPPSPEKSQKYRFSKSNAGPDPLKNHTAIKPSFNLGSSWARQQNAI